METLNIIYLIGHRSLLPVAMITSSLAASASRREFQDQDWQERNTMRFFRHGGYHLFCSTFSLLTNPENISAFHPSSSVFAFVFTVKNFLFCDPDHLGQ